MVDGDCQTLFKTMYYPSLTESIKMATAKYFLVRIAMKVNYFDVLFTLAVSFKQTRIFCVSVTSSNMSLGLTCILSHHPAKYLNVSMDMPMCVFSASVYTAPESNVSRVASSSLCESISSANLYMRVPRSRAFIRPHSPSSSALYRQKLSK